MEPTKPNLRHYTQIEDNLPTSELPPILEKDEEKELQWQEDLARMELRIKQAEAARANDAAMRREALRKILEEKKKVAP